MLNEVKHPELKEDLHQVVVRFFAEFTLREVEGLRMTSFIYSCQNNTCVKVSQVEDLIWTSINERYKNVGKHKILKRINAAIVRSCDIYICRS